MVVAVVVAVVVVVDVAVAVAALGVVVVAVGVGASLNKYAVMLLLHCSTDAAPCRASGFARARPSTWVRCFNCATDASTDAATTLFHEKTKDKGTTAPDVSMRGLRAAPLVYAMSQDEQRALHCRTEKAVSAKPQSETKRELYQGQLLRVCARALVCSCFMVFQLFL